VETVIRIGVLTPHEVAGPEPEFAAMAPGRLATRVAPITGTPGAGGSGGPTSPADLAALAAAPFPDRAAKQLLIDPVDVIGYASTTSAYAIGFAAETAMVSRLSQPTGLAVGATCASAVHALRALQVERVALVGAPWFDPEWNELGAAYFASQDRAVPAVERGARIAESLRPADRRMASNGARVARGSLAGPPVALASSGEALELPCMHARHPIVGGRWAEPRVAGNVRVTQGVHVRAVTVDPCM
jgi:hypothetical protein